MEDRLRDLEQIQEREPEEAGRRIGLLLLAASVIVAFIFAMGVVVGRAAKPDAERAEDPHARFDSAVSSAPKGKGESAAIPRIKREELTFPTVLTGKQDPPEVAAAIAAAAVEEADLTNKLSQSAAAAKLKPVSEPIPQPRPLTLPAAVVKKQIVATASRAGERTPLVKAPASKSREIEPAQPGREGEFSLQIISYERPEPARAFAKGLRARGHQTFVVAVDVPDRGRYWRVRIGPFDSKWEADEYRRKFEQEEHMNTIVVKRQKS